MYILGIYHGHNATATLMRDGKVIASVSEERFVRIKNYKGFPKNAIRYCLEEAEITAAQLDFVVRSTTIGSPIHASSDFNKSASINIMRLLHQCVNLPRKIWGSLAYYNPSIRFIGEFIYTITAKTIGWLEMEKEKEVISKKLNIPKNKICVFDHHDCHAFSAYFSSPYNHEKALVLVLDGEGDDCSATVYLFEKNNYKIIARSPRGASLGAIYARVTEFLGMKSNEHEYKVMGLAPYAKDEDVEKAYKKVEDIIFFDPENPLIFRSKFNTVDTDKFLNQNMRTVRFDILAGVFQKLVEEKIITWVNSAIAKTEVSTVILCGGVFMNVKANQKVLQQKKVKKLFIMPSCGDESTVLGACYYALINKFRFDSKQIKPMKDIYWGPQFSDEEIKQIIEKRKIKKRFFVKIFKDIEKETAKLITEGKIVARLKGRMEFGARALGNRSILANPSDPEVVRVINEQVKNRDFWMPFAPSVLKERENDYIINPKKTDSLYMMLGYNSTPLARKELKAALHPYDFTLRPQILSNDINPDYYRLIQEFEKLTGIGAVLNTSFNLHGSPIVLGPNEALDAFENSGLEYLTLGNYLISKNSQR